MKNINKEFQTEMKHKILKKKALNSTKTNDNAGRQGKFRFNKESHN